MFQSYEGLDWGWGVWVSVRGVGGMICRLTGDDIFSAQVA